MASINNLTSITQEQFLQLLTAQMQNQDPLNPLSDRDMVNQLSQISVVNGIAQLNATFAQVLQLQQLTQGSELIGRTVEFLAPGASGPATGVVSAVTATGGEINLQIGDQSVPLDSVTRVQATP